VRLCHVWASEVHHSSGLPLCAADGGEGRLSTRFEGSDNIWLKSWAAAEPLPVRQQKQLFDCTAAAEQTLGYLEAIPIGDLVQQLMPSLLQSAYERLHGGCERCPFCSF
jgi:hypothetical protein